MVCNREVYSRYLGGVVVGFAYAVFGDRSAALNAVRELRRFDPEKADKLFDLIVPR
jgi:hypothetical protein